MGVMIRILQPHMTCDFCSPSADIVVIRNSMCYARVRQEAVVWIAEQPDFPSVWDVPTVACGSGNGTV